MPSVLGQRFFQLPSRHISIDHSFTYMHLREGNITMHPPRGFPLPPLALVVLLPFRSFFRVLVFKNKIHRDEWEFWEKRKTKYKKKNDVIIQLKEWGAGGKRNRRSQRRGGALNAKVKNVTRQKAKKIMTRKIFKESNRNPSIFILSSLGECFFSSSFSPPFLLSPKCTHKMSEVYK